MRYYFFFQNCKSTWDIQLWTQAEINKEKEEEVMARWGGEEVCVGRWEEEENDYGGQREGVRGGGPGTDHRYSPPILHTHKPTHTQWSKVHLQFMLTMTTPRRKKWTRTVRGGNGEQGDVESGETDVRKEVWREERGERDNLGLRERRGIGLASGDAAVHIKVSEQNSFVVLHACVNCSVLWRTNTRVWFGFKQVFKTWPDFKPV